MKTPHKHAELIKAWADGATIQFKVICVPYQDWQDCTGNPGWASGTEYRIKPEPKPDEVHFKYVDVEGIVSSSSFAQAHKNKGANLKLILDGETGKLKEAIVL